jgi:hypothetical protein
MPGTSAPTRTNQPATARCTRHGHRARQEYVAAGHHAGEEAVHRILRDREMDLSEPDGHHSELVASSHSTTWVDSLLRDRATAHSAPATSVAYKW